MLYIWAREVGEHFIVHNVQDKMTWQLIFYDIILSPEFWILMLPDKIFKKTQWVATEWPLILASTSLTVEKKFHNI